MYIKGIGEFKELGAWSSKTVKMLGIKVLHVGEPSIGQKVPSSVICEVHISLEEFPDKIQ